MKAAVTALVAAGVVLAPQHAFSADADKTLTNVKGSVSYERSGKQKPLVSTGSVALATQDWAATGDASQARVTLPDSSRVLIASTTRVQMVRFEQSDIAHAQFIVDHGRVRFQVEHPQGTRPTTPSRPRPRTSRCAAPRATSPSTATRSR